MSARLELAFWTALALAGFALTLQFSSEPGGYRWGAASWPRAVLLLMLLAAVAQYAQRRARAAPAAPDSAEAAPEPLSDAAAAPQAGPVALTLLFALPFAYLLLLPRIGFYSATPLFLLLLLWQFGERRPAALLGVTLLTCALLLLVFTTLFYVALPTGSWPGFYDFSNWLISGLR